MWHRLAVTLIVFAGLGGPAYAQFPTTPGPDGTPLALGLPPTGYTPVGIGPGGTEVAPTPAARSIPMDRTGPGGIALPQRPDRYAENSNPSVPSCIDPPCSFVAQPRNIILTINSRDAAPATPHSADQPIDSIKDLFAALRACWQPPSGDTAQPGALMSARFSFKQSGELLAPPVVTYTTPGTKADAKEAYRAAITASLQRCAPLAFSKSFRAEIAGHPISIRYVDDRNSPKG
jgi:hypothetical protein